MGDFIRDRKLPEAALQEQINLLQLTLQSMSDGIVVADEQGQFLIFNPAAEQMFGQGAIETCPNEWSQQYGLFLPDQVTPFPVEELPLTRAIRGEETKDIELFVRHSKAPEGCWVLITGRPLRDEFGQLRGGVVVCRDITDRKQAETACAESEAKFRYLVENSTDLIWSSTLEGTLTYISPRFKDMAGYDPAEFLGKSFVPLVHPADLPGCLAFLNRVAETGEKQTGFEFRYIRKDGSWFWASSNVAPVKNEFGKVIGLQGIIQDISDRKRVEDKRKQAEDALKYSEERYRSLVRTTSQIVWSCTPEGLCFDVKDWIAYTGQSEAEAQGLGWLDAVHPDDRDYTANVWTTATQNRTLYEVEYRIRAKDGAYRDFFVCGAPILEEDGSIREWIGTCTDITDRKQAEQKLRQTLGILDLASDSIIIRDMDDRIQYWNQGAERLYGWKREEVIGQYIHTFLQTVFPQSLETCLTEFLQQGQWEGELQHTTREGQPIVVSSRWTLQRDASGQPFAQLEINSDVTQRKAAELALRQSEERLQAILDNSPAVIYMKDAQGRFVMVNRQFESLFRLSKAEIIGKRNCDLFEQELADTFDANDQAVLEARTAMQWEEVAPQEDGLHTYISLKFPLLTPEGVPYAVCGISTDITERKQAEVALTQAKEAAETANRAKSEFLANMSHELRTPLNGVIGYAQILLRDKTLSEEARSRIEVIHQCGSHLLTLINDVLDLSKIEARKVELTPTDFHLPAFLQGVSEMCRIRAELKGIQFQYESAAELPIGIRADEKRLRQVLINLLSNAIKFTDSGRVTFRVSFAAAGKIRFEVQDTGIGISQENLQAIFQPFEQVNDPKRQSEGTGLGLAISQEIVELMGSTIQVQSEVGIGSIFWFDVDFPQADEWVKTAQSDQHGQIIGIKDNQPKLLVIDDKWENRSVISSLLKPIGFEVLEAADGSEGWQKILEFRPDLVITDLLMPSRDGFELIKQIRASELFKDLIVIVSSASVFETDQYSSIEAGGNDFLPKPVLAVELLQKLQKHLQLQWIYEEPQSPAQPETDPVELVAPPMRDLEALYELAMKGNFIGITKQAVLLEQKDAKYSSFAKRLHQLAKRFQDQEILALLHSYK